MSTARNKQDLLAARQAARVTDEVVWIVSPTWMQFPDELRAKLKVGVNFLPRSDGVFRCYAKHLTGLVIEVIASPTASKADYQIAAKRLLAEVVAAHHRQMQQSIQKIRAQLTELGLDPDEIIRQARERHTAANNQPAPEAANEEPS